MGDIVELIVVKNLVMANFSSISLANNGKTHISCKLLHCIGAFKLVVVLVV